jgi:hypothetical protein
MLRTESSTKATWGQYQPAAALLLVHCARSRKVKREKLKIGQELFSIQIGHIKILPFVIGLPTML